MESPRVRVQQAEQYPSQGHWDSGTAPDGSDRAQGTVVVSLTSSPVFLSPLQVL